MFLTLFNIFNALKREYFINFIYPIEMFEIILFLFAGTLFAECLGKIGCNN